MYIGEASKRTGVTIKAIRHYEAIGLLPSPSRSGQYRVYSEEDLVLIGLIRQARTLGFKLSELKPLREDNNVLPTWRHILTLIDEKQAKMSAEISRLQHQRERLRQYHQDIEHCLAKHPDCATT